LNVPPKQDAGKNRQYAGDVGKDGYPDTKGSGPQVAGQNNGQRVPRGQDRKVDDTAPQLGDQTHFASGPENRDQWTTPGRDAGIYQHDAADRVRFEEVGDGRRLSDRDDDDDDNLRRSGSFEEEDVRRASGNPSGGKEKINPYGHQDRDNRKAPQKSDERRGQRQR